MSSIQRALISVSDKTDLQILAQSLADSNVEIVSTGGTASAIREMGIPVTDVSSVTNFPEILDGRVKTLHPSIHGGILADRSRDSHIQQMETFSIKPFDLVVVNLYPFQNTVRNHSEDIHRVIENIDIGGPCMIRAAAKNYSDCLVVTEPSDYSTVCELVTNEPLNSLELRQRFALKAFRHTCRYDYFIQKWFAEQIESDASELPDELFCLLSKDESLRYGENPHQQAAIYRIPDSRQNGLLGYTQLGGKALSFNNMLDLSAAWEMASMCPQPAAIVVKHQNPCGAAQSESLADAYDRALAGDPMSAFGGIVALNRVVTEETARKLHKTQFLEVIAAPEFQHDALELLKKKKNRRLVQIAATTDREKHLDIRMFHNGALIQTQDQSKEARDTFTVVTEIHPSDDLWRDLLFSWTICRHVKSNAIVLGKDQTILGVGAGQMSRVDSVKIAIRKAGNRIENGVMASDAFFPFRDGIDEAARAGIKAVIQPGGSKGDADVIAACNEAGIAMVFTGFRHFKH